MLKRTGERIVRWFWCVIAATLRPACWASGHEDLEQRGPGRKYLSCRRCGRETSGWTLPVSGARPWTVKDVNGIDAGAPKTPARPLVPPFTSNTFTSWGPLTPVQFKVPPDVERRPGGALSAGDEWLLRALFQPCALFTARTADPSTQIDPALRCDRCGLTAAEHLTMNRKG